MPDDDSKRFSDEELFKFHDDYKRHIKHESHDREQLLHCMNENKKAIQELTKLTNDSIKSTKGLVEAWDATTGAVKVTAVIGNVVKWGVTIGGPIYGIYLFIKHSGKV